MSKSKTGQKKYKKDVQSSNFYFALKSQNEIYFQMASIFKEASSDKNELAKKDKDELAKKVFKGFLIGNSSKISLEKPF
ncbi:MAG: hypothetical protein HN417_10835 [Desulfobacula sp.]|jgi:hypothetical protein|nr:hypothetical protein [Desulfobacula sp.]